MSYQQSWKPFFTVSLALIMGTIGTALASPLYPLYQKAWHLLASDITYIFVAYMFGCLATLLFLGRLSNSIGFLRTLKIGIILVTLGLVFSTFASDAILLGVGRFIIGIASGLITTSAMIGLVQTIPKTHQQFAPQLSSIIAAVGFGLGPLIGGLIAEFSTQPLITPYIVVILGAILCFLLLKKVTQPTFSQQVFSITPKLQTPEKKYRALFFILSLAAFSAFGAFSLFASLSPSFIKDIVPWHGPLMSGSAIAIILLISAVVQYLVRYLPPHKTLKIGLMYLVSSLVLLGFSIYTHWGILFFISDFLLGIGHGFTLLGTFGLIHQITQEHNRAAVFSTYLFIAYLGTIVPIIAVGYLADHVSLSFAVIFFCISMSLLGVCLFFLHKKWHKTALI